MQRNIYDWRVLEQQVKLYLKVGLPSAALHYCELYHEALIEGNLAEGLMLSKMAEANTLAEAAKQDIATPRWRFKIGDRVLFIAPGRWEEGRIVSLGPRLGDDVPEWGRIVSYGVLLVEECDCDEDCACNRLFYSYMDSDNLVRKVTVEYRQSLRRPPVTSAGPVDMAAMERELLPLLAAQDRRWLESTGNVSATVSRLYMEYNRLVAPRKQLTEAASAESPARILSRLFPGQSELLRSVAGDESLDTKARAAAWGVGKLTSMALICSIKKRVISCGLRRVQLRLPLCTTSRTCSPISGGVCHSQSPSPHPAGLQ
jgi:hypothetical protein